MMIIIVRIIVIMYYPPNIKHHPNLSNTYRYVHIHVFDGTMFKCLLKAPDMSKITSALSRQCAAFIADKLVPLKSALHCFNGGRVGASQEVWPFEMSFQKTLSWRQISS